MFLPRRLSGATHDPGRVDPSRTLDKEGISDAEVHWNLSEPVLYEQAIRRQGGARGRRRTARVPRTGQHTGRSPNDKFIVREPSTEREIAWGGFNRPMSPEHFDQLHRDMLTSFRGSELFVQDCYAGADQRYRLPIRVITEFAWHSLFARNLFIPGDSSGDVPELTIIGSPSFKADPARHGTNSEVVVALNFAKRLVLIGGTNYAGEIKKSVFSTLNYLLPLRGVLSMHCSANIGPEGDTALFFGLSGTGKTTLSSDPDRGLIGDDEHGWSDHGVFNFEGGCYAKTIRLSAEAEPEIYATTRRFGTVLENVVIDPITRTLDLDSDRFTENTRAAYPIAFISNAVPSGQGGAPSERRHAHGGRVRSAASDRAAVAGCRDVPLPVGLHRQGCGHRERHHRAEGNLQYLFRCAVPAAGAEPLRGTPRRQDQRGDCRRRCGW